MIDQQLRPGLELFPIFDETIEGHEFEFSDAFRPLHRSGGFTQVELPDDAEVDPADIIGVIIDEAGEFRFPGDLRVDTDLFVNFTPGGVPDELDVEV